jgi:hypothetical protein
MQGDMIITCTPTGSAAVTSATFQIAYPGTIANRSSFRPAIVTSTGQLTAVTSALITYVTGTGGVSTPNITISMPPFTPSSVTSTITISGILASVPNAGTAEGASGSATLTQTTTGTNYTLIAPNTAVSYSSALTGIGTVGIGAGGVATITSGGAIVKANFSVAIPENFVDAYKGIGQLLTPTTPPNSVTMTNSTQLQVTFNNLQPGELISGPGGIGSACQVVVATTGTTSAVGTFSPATISNLTNQGVVTFTGTFDQTAVDTITLNCNINPGTTTTTFTQPITAQVSLGPTGTAGFAAASDQIPRFASNLQPATPLTVVTIVGTAPTNQTLMLVPYAIFGVGFNTGIAVANTTSDPFGPSNGGATPTAGTITFQGFGESVSATGVRTPVTFTATIASVPAGTTKNVLLSDLLTAGGVSTTGCGSAGGSVTCFTGYIFATANFTLGHGTAFVADVNFGSASTKFSQGSPVLVLPPVSAGSPRPSFEALDQ